MGGAMGVLRLLTASVALVHVHAETPVAKSPLISTELLYGTYEILLDARDFAWKKADVDAIVAKVPVDQWKAEVMKRHEALPPPAQDAILQAKTAILQLKELVAEHSQKAYDPLDKAAVGMIDSFES